MILFCYDGSTDAQAAIDTAAQLMLDAGLVAQPQIATRHGATAQSIFADRPVLVVPSPELAEQRRDRAGDVSVTTGAGAPARLLEPT